MEPEHIIDTYAAPSAPTAAPALPSSWPNWDCDTTMTREEAEMPR